MIIIAFKK